MTRTNWLVMTVILGAFSLPASADVGLADWCVNVNGNIDACNGGTSNASVDLSAFDTTLEGTAANTLGTITVTLGPGSNEFANVYMDYDLNFAAHGSFNDFGTVNGALPGGVSYELDDPNTSNIFSDFSGNTLTDANNVPTPNTTDPCCDVAFALGISGINVAAGDTAVVTFTVSEKNPGGFNLLETNQLDGETVLLAGSVSCNGPNCAVVSPVPEPKDGALLLVMLSIVFIVIRKRRTQVL